MTKERLYGVVILAGGNSSRMNYPKSWLGFSKSETFLSHIVSVYLKMGIKNIVVVLNHKFYTKEWRMEIKKVETHATIIQNVRVDQSRMHSIQLGMKELEECDYVYIQNVDNPFVNAVVLQNLQEYVPHNGFSVPCFNGRGGHPVLVSKEVQKSISKNENYAVDLKTFLASFRRKNISVDDSNVLVNINTPEVYKKVCGELI